MLKIIHSSLVAMPAPVNISTLWNFGSLLGGCLVLQILTGLFLAMHFSCHSELAFDNIVHICRDVNYGWLLRTLHANGASFFFIFLFLHIGRGMYYSSYLLIHTWLIGVTILLLAMATAFLGYVLPWGQMSLWGASVITNLLSTIPFIGNSLVQWLWGGFAINTATLTRFFALHFILPFVILALVIVHITFLHQTGSSNPLGMNSNLSKLYFQPYFIVKDAIGFLCMSVGLLSVCLWIPYTLSDPENFNPANPLSSPPHIQPEWYYLFAYAILRSIPNKLGGVLALVFSIIILYFMPLMNYCVKQPIQFYPANKLLLMIFFVVSLLLTWIGANPVEDPYIIVGQILTILYFSFFVLNPLLVINRKSF